MQNTAADILCHIQRTPNVVADAIRRCIEKTS